MTSQPTSSNSPTHSVPFELQSLASAHRYQRWLRDSISPYMGERILELGSGIGNLSQHLPVRERLILSDIDPSLLEVLKSKFPESKKTSLLLLDPSIPLSQRFQNENLDTVVSFNVLEHVQDDSALLKDAIQLLKQSRAPGPKRLVSVVPAHQWAYGPVDQQFGHYRRYSDKTYRTCLQKAGANNLDQEHYCSRYINLAGLIGWWINGRILKKSEIGVNNMRLFELLCPLIRPLDNFLQVQLKIPFGNSLLAVYMVNDA